MKSHIFDVAIATEYGLNAAIVLHHIAYWCEKNAANGRNFHDGNYWTYNSYSAFATLLPYLSERQIKTALDKLIDEGLIVAGCYNTDQRDRTRWYAVTKKGACILQNDILHEAIMSDGDVENVRPLPDSKPYSKPHILQEEQRAREGWDEFVKTYESNLGLLPRSEVELSDLSMFFDEFGAEAICELIRQSARKHPDNPHTYFSAICRKHLGKGIKTAEQVKAAFMDFDRKHGKGRDAPVNELVYADEDDFY